MSFSVSGRGHSGYRFEYTVKVRQIGKTRLITDLCDILIGFHELSLSIHHSGDIYILDYCAAGMALELSTQIIRTDIESLSQCLQTDIILIVTVNIADNLAYSVTIFPSSRILSLYLKNDRK